MKFRSDEDGFITALRFYKQPNNTARTSATSGRAPGQQLAEVQFTGETASGWQEATLPVPVPITRDTTYITSYHSSQGQFGFNRGYFFAGVDRAPLHAPSDLAGAATASTTTGPAVPRLDLQRAPTTGSTPCSSPPPADTRAPLVSSVSPAAGATGVSGHAPVDRHLRRAARPAHRERGVVHARRRHGHRGGGAGDLRPGDPQGDAHAPAPARARQDLHRHGQERHRRSRRTSPATGWPPTRRGRSARPPQCPCTVFGAGDAPTGDAVSDQPVEVGMKFRSDEDGYITALRFYKQANNTGTHVGHLWSGTGQLLAAATFTGETASGWQQVTSRTRCRSPRTPPTSPPTTRARGATGSARASSTRAWTARRCTPRATVARRQRRLPLRRQRASRTRASTRPTTGSTRPSTGRSPRTRAGRRSRSTRPRRAPRTCCGHARSRRPSTSSSRRPRSPARPSPCATRTATSCRPT